MSFWWQIHIVYLVMIVFYTYSSTHLRRTPSLRWDSAQDGMNQISLVVLISLCWEFFKTSDVDVPSMPHPLGLKGLSLFYTSVCMVAHFYFCCSIQAYINKTGVTNVLQPLYIDITQPVSQWPDQENLKPESCDAIINVNMIHISPWETCEVINRLNILLCKHHSAL